MSKRGGLGRGLSALIPGAPEAGEGFAGLLEVPVNAVAPTPSSLEPIGTRRRSRRWRPRSARSGSCSPSWSAGPATRYELVAGERRLRAAKVAGLATVPVVLRETGDADLLREALIENIHREDLSPIELAEAFRQLLEELGLKQEELAERVGVSRSHIANTIRLLQLPLESQQLLTDGKISGRPRASVAVARRRRGRRRPRPAGRRRGPLGPRDRGARPPLRGGAAPSEDADGRLRRRHAAGRAWPRSRRSCPSSSPRGSRSRWARSAAA